MRFRNGLHQIRNAAALLCALLINVFDVGRCTSGSIRDDGSGAEININWPRPYPWVSTLAICKQLQGRELQQCLTDVKLLLCYLKQQHEDEREGASLDKNQQGAGPGLRGEGGEIEEFCEREAKSCCPLIGDLVSCFSVCSPERSFVKTAALLEAYQRDSQSQNGGAQVDGQDPLLSSSLEGTVPLLQHLAALPEARQVCEISQRGPGLATLALLTAKPDALLTNFASHSAAGGASSVMDFILSHFRLNSVSFVVGREVGQMLSSFHRQHPAFRCNLIVVSPSALGSYHLAYDTLSALRALAHPDWNLLVAPSWFSAHEPFASSSSFLVWQSFIARGWASLDLPLPRDTLTSPDVRICGATEEAGACVGLISFPSTGDSPSTTSTASSDSFQERAHKPLAGTMAGVLLPLSLPPSIVTETNTTRLEANSSLRLTVPESVLVMGDSHANSLLHIGFDIVVVPGATAQGAINPHSKSNALATFTEFCNKERARQADYAEAARDLVVIMMGEVDCGFVIWFRAEKHHIPIEEQTSLSISNLLKFVTDVVVGVLGVPPGRVVLVGPHLPTIPDNSAFHGEVANARSTVHASRPGRTALTLRFCEQLRRESERAGFRYLDITHETMSPLTGEVQTAFLHHDKANDHHLDSSSITSLYALKFAALWGSIVREEEEEEEEEEAEVHAGNLSARSPPLLCDRGAAANSCGQVRNGAREIAELQARGVELVSFDSEEDPRRYGVVYHEGAVEVGRWWHRA